MRGDAARSALATEAGPVIHATFDLRSTILYYAVRVTSHALVILKYFIILSLILTPLNILANLDTFIRLVSQSPPNISVLALLIFDSWIYGVAAYVVVAALKAAFEKLYMDYIESKVKELESIISSGPGAMPVAKLAEMLDIKRIYEFLAAANAYLLKKNAGKGRELEVYRINVDPNTGVEYVVKSTLSGQLVYPTAAAGSSASDSETEVFGSFSSGDQQQ